MSESCKVGAGILTFQEEIICFELNQAEMVDVLKLNVLTKHTLRE